MQQHYSAKLKWLAGEFAIQTEMIKEQMMQGHMAIQ